MQILLEQCVYSILYIKLGEYILDFAQHLLYRTDDSPTLQIIIQILFVSLIQILLLILL